VLVGCLEKKEWGQNTVYTEEGEREIRTRMRHAFNLKHNVTCTLGNNGRDMIRNTAT